MATLNRDSYLSETSKRGLEHAKIFIHFTEFNHYVNKIKSKQTTRVLDYYYYNIQSVQFYKDKIRVYGSDGDNKILMLTIFVSMINRYNEGLN